jgi:hypothetical protein
MLTIKHVDGAFFFKVIAGKMSVVGISTDGYYAQNGSLKCIIITL